MAPRARRDERRVSPLADYAPEPGHPPAYHAPHGQPTTTYPSGNTASYYRSDPAPIQPAQQPSSQLYDRYEYPQQTQGPSYDQSAYPQHTQIPSYDEHAYLRQPPNPYLTPSTVERTSYEQAPPDYAYNTHASANYGQPPAEYQQSSQYTPSYSQRERHDATAYRSDQRLSSYELWDLSQRQIRKAESASQHPSSLRGSNESQPGSCGDPRDRHRQEEPTTRRRGRDALVGESVVEPARASKKPRRRHGSIDIVNVTQALGQASLTAPANAQGGLEQGTRKHEESRETAMSGERLVRPKDTQRRLLPRTSAAEVVPPIEEKDQAAIQRREDRRRVTDHKRYLRDKAEEIKASKQLQLPLSEQDKEAEKVKKAKKSEYNRQQYQKPEIKQRSRAQAKERSQKPEWIAYQEVKYEERKTKEAERRQNDDPEITARRIEEESVRKNQTTRKRRAKQSPEQRKDSPSPRR